MPTFAHICCASLVSMAMLALSGCAPEAAYLRQTFAHPGPAKYQRAQAIHHDPYVLNDLGPEVVGGRPRDYLIPMNEVERTQMNAPRPASLGPPASVMPVVVGPPPGPAPVYSNAPALPSSPYGSATAPIVTTPAPMGPPATPYAVAPAPPAAPYSVAPAPQSAPFPTQNRAPY